MEATMQKPCLHPAWPVEVAELAWLRTKGPHITAWLWSRHFSPEQRRLLGTSVDEAYQTHRGNVGMWRRVYGMSALRAVVEFNRLFNLMDAGTADRLLREC
jgi:hypothetical protein